VLKKLAGVAQQRQMPRYAEETFQHWFARRGSARSADPERTVMLWPDTFNNYFRPETAIAATHVLEKLGFTVIIPEKPVCCGRPLYDWGMLDKARRLWTETIDTLTPAIRLGIPIVGLEPACVSAFRDELPGLMHGNERAARLGGQVVFFTEFLDHNCAGTPLPQIAGTGLVQMHCHHHAVIKTSSEEAVLKRLGLDYEVMKSGCCGMAGSFGFEADKYEVSMKAAERVLLPKLRQAPEETIVIANGFSCREQIEQGSSRKTQHIAELMDSHLSS
jgi:Fe-S oxidoreductase